MIQINDQQLFDKVVSDAIESACLNAKDEQTASRWCRAIDRAVSEILENPYLEFDFETHQLLICSPSNNIYSANGVCQCKAFTVFHVPCWHRAAARIVRLYFEALNKPPMAKAAVATTASPLRVINHEDTKAIYLCGGIRREEQKTDGFRL